MLLQGGWSANTEELATGLVLAWARKAGVGVGDICKVMRVGGVGQLFSEKGLVYGGQVYDVQEKEI